MIEIRITIDTALSLLLERMKFELKLRQRQKMIKPGLSLEQLSQKDLLELVEASVFDTIFLLPIDLIKSDSNLTQIIISTIHALSRVLHRDDLLLYSSKRAKGLIEPIFDYFQNSLKDKQFTFN